MKPTTYQDSLTKFKVFYADSDSGEVFESVIEARNEAHAGKRFKKLHNLSVCACKFRMRVIK